MKKYLLVNIIIFLTCQKAQAQGDNSFKIMASFAGLGAAYEYNPAKVVYVQGLINTSFTITRFGLQTKLAVLNKDNFKIKVGVEGDYFLGRSFRVGGVEIEYDDFEFMPLVAFEWKIVGIEIPLIIERDLSSVFPLLGITLNVSKDEKNPKDPNRKRRKK